MHTFMKLDANVASILCCPLCKGILTAQTSRYVCCNCGSVYPLISAPNARAYDFRIHRPTYLIPQCTQKWHVIQGMYEGYERECGERDDMQEYLDEIDSVREIYTTEFHITGSVLDVGGHQGRLRHYLSPEEVPLYVSIDPFIDVFRYVQKPNLQKAYPCLSIACNFLAGHAENLPFIANSFDWVHMRSVVDHFEDPYLAFKEAYRVLKPGGHVLIGLSIEERVTASRQGILQRASRILRSGGVSAVRRAIRAKLARSSRSKHDDHNYRLKYQELLDLISITNFILVKEHWQKPPYSYVIYVSAKKIAVP